MKIIDCFIFYNELDMLYYRLNNLKDVIDYFIIVEAKYTFIGKEKELFFEKNKDKFDFCKEKIIHIILEDFPHKYPNIDFTQNHQWINEIYQRNNIKLGIDKLVLEKNDKIILTDIDEIPDKKILYHIKNNNINFDALILEMDMYYYNLTCKLVNKWYHAKIFSYEYYISSNLQLNDIRMNLYNIIKYGGWHLSYFGNAHFIKNKIENFAHQEFNNEEITNIDNINNRIKNKIDIVNRTNIQIDNIKIEDNNYLPSEYNIYLLDYIL